MTTNRNIGVSLTADPTQLQAGLRTASSAAQQFATTTNEAFGRASAASARLGQSSKGLAESANQQTLAARAHQAAADRFVRDMERQAAAIGKTRSELLSLQAAELGVENQAAPFIAKIRETEQALGAGAIQFNRYGLSAKQTEAALRGVPAQITDIFVSLQGGQRPMTVLLQQGGQLKDMFGGIVPAAQALTSTALKMISPVTVLAGASALLFAAYHQGSSELDEYRNHLDMTGNALGVTTGQLSDMSAQMARASDITRGQAVAALTEVAKSGKIAGDQIETVATAAARSANVLGRETSDVVAEFAKLADEPSKAAAELNEKYNFLSISVYRQIRALEEQGRTQDAVRLAVDEFGRVTNERLDGVEKSLGSVERAWLFVKNEAKGAWDAMLNVGRPAGLNDQLKEAEERLGTLRVLYRTSAAGDPDGLVAKQERVVASIRGQIDAEYELAGLEEARAQNRRGYIEAEQRWQKQSEEFQSRTAQRDKEIEQARADGRRLRLKDEEIETRIAAIRKKYEERGSGGISATQTELARLNAAIEAEKQREIQLHATAGAQANLNEYEKLAIQYGEKIKLVTDSKTKAELQNLKAKAEQAGAMRRANDEYDKQTKAAESSIAAVRKQTDTLEDQIATYGLGKSAIEAMTIAELENQLAVNQGLANNERTIELLRTEIAERHKLLDAMRTKEALDAQLKEWQVWEREIDRIFQRVGQSATDQIFEGGVKARDLLKDIFKGLTFNIAINPVMQAGQQWVTNQLGGMLGLNDPRQQGNSMLGMAQNVNTAYQAYSGGMASNMGQMIGRLGNQFGSEALRSFGMGMTGSVGAAGTVAGITSLGAGLGTSLGASIGASAAAGFVPSFSAAMTGGALIPGLGVGAAGGGVAAGAGAAAAAGASGAAGFGAMAGAALPWVGGALAIGSLLGGSGLFGSREPTTRRGQRTTIDYLDGAFGVSAVDGRQAAGADAAARQLAEAAVQTANDIFRQVGVDAAIDSFYAVMESSYKGDRDGVASGGTLRIGGESRQIGVAQASDMTLAGFGGWSEAEMLPRLATDIQLSILDAFQQAGVMSNMLGGVNVRGLDATAAQELAATVQAVVEQTAAFQVAMEALPFANLRDLGFDAAASLIQLAGGVDALMGAQQTYVQNFYTEAERQQIAVNNLTSALADAGVVMPELTGSADDMRAAYRALVEAQDINSEAGRQAYVTLMGAAGAFAEVATFAGQAETAVDSVAASMESITSLFVGAVDHAYSEVVRLGQARIAELQQTFGQTDTVFNAYRSAVQRFESEWGGVISTMERSMRDLRGQVEASARLQYDQARAVISTTLLTGQLPQTADLSEALRTAQQGVSGQRYSSLFEQQRAYLTLANEIEALQDIAGPELDTARATLEQLENQYRLLRGMSDVGEGSLAALEQQVAIAFAAEEAARYQIGIVEQQLEVARENRDAALGLNTLLDDLPSALQSFADALSNLRLGGGATLNTKSYLESNPDLVKWYQQNYTGNQTIEEWARDHYNQYGQHEGRAGAPRAFAAGGYYSGGLALVGEEGPELINFRNPGQVYRADQTQDILQLISQPQGGFSTAALERRLEEGLAENRKLVQYSYKMLTELMRIKNNTEDTATAVRPNSKSQEAVLVF